MSGPTGPSATADRVHLGIDVGTAGARAGLFDLEGVCLAHASKAFDLLRAEGGIAEYDSREIWSAVCAAVRAAMTTAGLPGERVAGIGFDATCSMVIVSQGGSLSVNPSGATSRDSIAWLDHRATQEAAEINATGAAVLNAVGGRISPEMQVPKLLWLARYRPDVLSEATALFDLPDWLVYRATGAETRSLCSLVCKWTYRGAQDGWDEEFLRQLGLSSLLEESARRIGREALSPGALAGHLTAAAAQDMGLPVGIPVATSLIDAHAGALGSLGAGGGFDPANPSDRLALIAGTSACHIVLTPKAVPVPGIWGPYPDVILPDLWALEAGQSACGALLDTIIARHGASHLAGAASNINEELACRLSQMAGAKDLQSLAHARHVGPDILGNRSPLADPSRRGAVIGLGLDSDLDDLALDYLAGIQALACGTRQILDAMALEGVLPSGLVMSGGLTQNRLFLQATATATGCDVILPEAGEPVLLGSAMLAAVAAGAVPTLADAMSRMGGTVVETIRPDPSNASYFEAKHRVFLQMQADQANYAKLMQSSEAPT